MSRQFLPNSPTSTIQQYLHEAGLTMTERFFEDGTPSGFHVDDTYVRVAYDYSVDGQVRGQGMVGLHEPFPADSNMVERSRKLYERLYRRFRRREEVI